MDALSPEEYARLEPRVEVSTEAGTVYYCVPNHITRWRVETLFTKEPDTIEWIAGFRSDEVMLDVGANVGMYSIWAARTRGVGVYAFEPESQNFAILNRNIVANGLADRINAYCVALSDRAGFGRLSLSEFAPGGSGHCYRAKGGVYEQGCYSSTIDELVASAVMPIPHHIKIDVDGIERLIIDGAKGTLASPLVRSILIEINSNVDDHWEIVDMMLELGFGYSIEQADAARRTEGPFKGVGNFIFRR